MLYTMINQFKKDDTVNFVIEKIITRLVEALLWGGLI